MSYSNFLTKRKTVYKFIYKILEKIKNDFKFVLKNYFYEFNLKFN